MTSLNRELIEQNQEVYALKHENKALKDALRMKQFNFNKIKDNDADMNFFTGLSCAALFMCIVRVSCAVWLAPTRERTPRRWERVR